MLTSSSRLMLLRRQLGRGLLLLLGFTGLHLQGLLDHPIGEGIEVSGQGALQFLEFRPEGVVDEAAAQPRGQITGL